MSEIDSKKIVGDTFEDMSIWEMTMVQGSGDMEPNSLTVASAVLMSAAATGSFSIAVTKTVKGKC
ncbi:lichenicidin A2 family type 2 lantibiotic [Clostridium perfringens]|uniref:Type 2 lantibiotic n=2 Tax=Clostridium perfringens TaxID=1502 RepID=A0A2X3AFP6_CLOPF|nr:lichenicidin A2 family type 2 lantibiotic [Clostridium perfringens]EDT22998.1 conserved domain protein [Clostridium perfringens B str. ATCC 3626]NGT47111.1 type 2 lantibiotic [Clostridium perfringens]NGT52797.1 type 2 lantibiotic [Clostridium perfringens]NGT55808.1 type 2 lantibiotic [Clostridium perfringens]NGT59234.1 type 2 lantibiotic [Clostridium perfringens]